MKNYQYDRHHIIPKSHGGNNHDDNIKRMKVNQHRALHHLFENDKPVEQIKKLVDISNTALTEEFKLDLIELLSGDELDYYYKTHIFKKKRKT